MGNDKLLGLPLYGVILNQWRAFYVNDILDHLVKPYLSCKLFRYNVYVDLLQFYIASVLIPVSILNFLGEFQWGLRG